MKKESANDTSNRPRRLRTLERLLWDFGGQTYMGCQVSQYPIDLILWERFLNDTPDIRFIIELGIGNGGMALFLALQAYQRGMEFRSFDHVPPTNLETPLARLLELESKFILGDLLGEASPALLKVLNDMPRPTLIFCDNGRESKDKEFETYVPYLQDGDYVAVHDWHTSIKASTLAKFDELVPMQFDLWGRADSITRFMRITK